MSGDDIYSARYGVRRCWCGRPDCRRWCVGDFVQGTIEASMTERQAKLVAFVLNAFDGEDSSPTAVTITTPGGTKTDLF